MCNFETPHQEMNSRSFICNIWAKRWYQIWGQPRKGLYPTGGRRSTLSGNRTADNCHPSSSHYDRQLMVFSVMVILSSQFKNPNKAVVDSRVRPTAQLTMSTLLSFSLSEIWLDYWLLCLSGSIAAYEYRMRHKAVM